MGNIFNDDFREFMEALNGSQTRYVLVGGYSVIYYGFPRNTGDLDIFVEVSKANYEKLSLAFAQFKMPVFDMTEENFLNNQALNVFTFGRPPVSIEILKEISGITFEEVFSQSKIVNIDGLEVRIIQLSHLKQNKKASGRNKDLNDLENLPDA